MAQVPKIGNETVSLLIESHGEFLTETVLYPLRFEPIYQYRLWGGRRLADILTAPLPTGPIGEAWILSDRKDHASQVADGSLKGQTIAQLMAEVSGAIAGKASRAFPTISAAAEIPRCSGNAVGAGASQRIECQPAASRRDRKDRSMGCAGSWAKKPHLCGPDARYDCSQFAAIACQRDCARPPCVLYSQAW